ncbi:hypothetical protein IV71_GL000531 [Fructobacillus fructosus KCTC 3544]|nr:hypothetical protein IV71_GL000531 [Fructobacillus fructosus KCTC 3544]
MLASSCDRVCVSCWPSPPCTSVSWSTCVSTSCDMSSSYINSQ